MYILVVSGDLQCPPLDYLVVALYLIAHLEVRPAFEAHSAFCSLPHLSGILFAVLERRKRTYFKISKLHGN